MGSHRRQAQASQEGLERMTKKNFIAIANIVKAQDLTYDQREQLSLDFANYFRKENPRFDIQRFVNACRK